MVVPGVLALHTHPQYWGPDALSWRPSSWIIPTPATINASPSPGLDDSDFSPLDHESIITPQKGSYIAWSGGPRVCPGKKLSQVEVLAVLVRLFRNHVVRPVQMPGDDAARAQRRVLEVVEDSQVHLLLRMNDPSRVALKWERR